MHISQLHVFLAVAKWRNFSRAAESLHMAQPTVSQQIARLERQLDVRLFERTSKSVTLTAAGQALYEQARIILEQFAELKRAVIEAEGRIAGPLVLGASMTVGQYFLPSAITRFSLHYPDVQVRLHIANTQQIVARLEAGDIDLGLVEGSVEGTDLIEEAFADDEVVFIAAADHPWQNVSILSLHHLERQAWIVREEGSGTRKLFERHLRAANLAPDTLRIVAEMVGTEAVKGAVEAGMGVAAISRWAVRKEQQDGRLIVRTVANMPMRRTFRFILRPGRTLVPAAAAFRRQLLAP